MTLPPIDQPSAWLMFSVGVVAVLLGIWAMDQGRRALDRSTAMLTEARILHAQVAVMAAALGVGGTE